MGVSATMSDSVTGGDEGDASAALSFPQQCEDLLKQGLRIDGRRLDQTRDLSVKHSSFPPGDREGRLAEGSVAVRLQKDSKTFIRIATCTITGKLVRRQKSTSSPSSPLQEDKISGSFRGEDEKRLNDEGEIETRLDFILGGFPVKDFHGESSNWIYLMRSYLHHLLLQSVPLHHLVAQAAQHDSSALVVWRLTFHFRVFENSGNLVDLLGLSANAALAECNLPEVCWNEEKQNYLIQAKRKGKPLPLTAPFIIASTAILCPSSPSCRFVVDCSQEEEEVGVTEIHKFVLDTIDKQWRDVETFCPSPMPRQNAVKTSSHQKQHQQAKNEMLALLLQHYLEALNLPAR